MDKTEIIIFIIISSITIAVFITALFVFVFEYRKKKQQQLIEAQKIKLKHQQELLSTQLEMQTQTMQYIGREIHDNVGQKLTLASLYTQQLAYENKAPQINEKIENISQIINESLAELRQLSKSLTDDSIADNTITTLLQQECDKVNSTKKCTVDLSSDQQNIILTYQTKSILVRIVQEFLQNSIKHSGCKKIDVSLNQNHNSVFLQLKDDGKGFDPEKMIGNGIGLKNMKKRAELINGIFTLDSTIGSGTKIDIEIPLVKHQ